MAKLLIKSKARAVYVVGEFCNWDCDKAIKAELKPKNKHIVVGDMPSGEYRVLNCKSYHGGEVYPTDGRQMANRYFDGTDTETIHCYF